MARKRKPRVDTESGDETLGQNPFADALAEVAAPDRPIPEGMPGRERAKGPRSRLDVRRETRGRGGKTVVVISDFPPTMGEGEIKKLLKELQQRCATGGSVKDGQIEIQGEHRDAVLKVLQERGFRPVAAGG